MRWGQLHRNEKFPFLQRPRQLGGLVGGVGRPCFRFVAHQLGGERPSFGRDGRGLVNFAAHGGDVVGRGAATAAHQPHAKGAIRADVLGKIGGRGGVEHSAALNVFGPARVGRPRQRHVGHNLVHGGQQAQQLGGAATAIHPQRIYPELFEPQGNLQGRVAHQGAVVPVKCHLGNDGNVGGEGAGDFDGRFYFVQIGLCLEDEPIYPPCVGWVYQGVDLLHEGGAGFALGDTAEGSQCNGQRADRPRQQDGAEGAVYHPPGNGDGRAVEFGRFFGRAMLAQLKPIGIKGVGFDDICPRFNVSAVNFGHQFGVFDVEQAQRPIHGRAVAVEQGSHRAIEEEGFVFGRELFAKLGAVHGEIETRDRDRGVHMRRISHAEMKSR